MKLPKDLRRHYQMRRSGFKCLEVGGFRVQGLGRFVPCDARAIAEAGNLEALQRDLVQQGAGFRVFANDGVAEKVATWVLGPLRFQDVLPPWWWRWWLHGIRDLRQVRCLDNWA